MNIRAAWGANGKVHVTSATGTLCGRPLHGQWEWTEEPVTCRQCAGLEAAPNPADSRRFLVSREVEDALLRAVRRRSGDIEFMERLHARVVDDKHVLDKLAAL